MKRKQYLAAVLLLLFTAAALHAGPDSGNAAQKPLDGFKTAGRGFFHFVLSPLQMTTGLLEGLTALPYFAATGLHDINARLVETQANVTLDDTYEAAYGKRLKDVQDDGSTGEVFRRMKHATEHFQKVLKQYGVKDSDRYLLTSIDTAKDRGYVLFAVVYRPTGNMLVLDKNDNRTTRSLTPNDRLYYEPYEKDARGNSLDRVIDFGGFPTEEIGTQKMQAVMLTLAANAVIRNKESPEYWQVERRWINGQYMEVMRERQSQVEEKMGLR